MEITKCKFKNWNDKRKLNELYKTWFSSNKIFFYVNQQVFKVILFYIEWYFIWSYQTLSFEYSTNYDLLYLFLIKMAL